MVGCWSLCTHNSKVIFLCIYVLNCFVIFHLTHWNKPEIILHIYKAGNKCNLFWIRLILLVSAKGLGVAKLWHKPTAICFDDCAVTSGPSPGFWEYHMLLGPAYLS